MGFKSDLVARQVGDFDWQLVEPLVYEGNEETFQVPIDAQTDFASVPLAFQWAIPRSGRYTRAAVLHDYLWRTRSVSLRDADGLFRRAMADLDVPFLRRWMIWAAVRVASVFKGEVGDWVKDLPRVLLIAVAPGSIVLVGGAVVLVLLLGFWVFEAVVYAILCVLRQVPATRARLKPTCRPTVLWSS